MFVVGPQGDARSPSTVITDGQPTPQSEQYVRIAVIEPPPRPAPSADRGCREVADPRGPGWPPARAPRRVVTGDVEDHLAEPRRGIALREPADLVDGSPRQHHGAPYGGGMRDVPAVLVEDPARLEVGLKPEPGVFQTSACRATTRSVPDASAPIQIRGWGF